ncbi:MAG: hypothetical protein LBD87_00350 [Prevotellaceae bacterium]|nr:hypothetical protein [Prevotellaceae bacterium]
MQKTTQSGKTYREHLLVDKAAEAAGNREIAALLLDNRQEGVKLLPKIHAKETTLRERYFSKEYVKLHPTSNPDAVIDGTIIEFKKTNKNKFISQVGIAAKQSDVIFVSTTEILTDIDIKEKITKIWNMNDRKNIKKIIVHNAGAIQTFNRP